MSQPQNCHDCGVPPGSMHKSGCDVERCALCGRQAIACGCVFIAAGADPDAHPDGPTEEMYAAYDAAVAKVGGPLPWSGRWPGEVECVEFGWFSRWAPGWVRCTADHPDARPDFNRLAAEGEWDAAARRYVKRDERGQR